MVPCFLVLGLIKKFEVSSFTFPVGTVLPFFFTGSWKKGWDFLINITFIFLVDAKERELM